MALSELGQPKRFKFQSELTSLTQKFIQFLTLFFKTHFQQNKVFNECFFFIFYYRIEEQKCDKILMNINYSFMICHLTKK